MGKNQYPNACCSGFESKAEKERNQQTKRDMKKQVNTKKDIKINRFTDRIKRQTFIAVNPAVFQG